MNDMLKKRPLTVNHTYDCLFKNRTRGLAEMDYDGSVVPIGKLMKYSTRKIINFLKLTFVFTIPTTSLHTCKKRVMLRRRLFWPKEICRKSA